MCHICNRHSAALLAAMLAGREVPASSDGEMTPEKSRELAAVAADLLDNAVPEIEGGVNNVAGLAATLEALSPVYLYVLRAYLGYWANVLQYLGSQTHTALQVAARRGDQDALDLLAGEELATVHAVIEKALRDVKLAQRTPKPDAPGLN